MANEQQKPKSILEALGTRGEETEPEVTTEEHVVEALGSASLIDRLESEQYPETPPQVEILNARKQLKNETNQMKQERTITVNPPATEKQTTPASNIVPQPVAETSIPELQEQPPQEKCDHTFFEVGPVQIKDEMVAKCTKCGIETNYHVDLSLRRIKSFVEGELYSVNWVRLHLLHVSRIQQALPSPTLWAIPGNLDVAKLVYDIVLSPGYVEVKWPVLQVLMGASIDNTEWCVGVLTTLALFDGISLLPYAGMNEGTE